MLNLALLMAIAFSLWGLVGLWWGGDNAASGSSAAKGPQVPMAPILRDQEPMSSFAVIAAKNLFSLDRKGPALGQADSQNGLDGRQLLGTIIIGQTRVALIGGFTGSPTRGGSEVEVVHVGEEWSGFKIVNILNDEVILQGKDGRRTLNFPE